MEADSIALLTIFYCLSVALLDFKVYNLNLMKHLRHAYNKEQNTFKIFSWWFSNLLRYHCQYTCTLRGGIYSEDFS